MLSRRRFLAISAASSVAVPAAAETVWRGAALGAQAEIRLAADAETTRNALRGALDSIERVERAFSLYREGSELNRLNQTGRLRMSPTFAALANRIDNLHRLTDGLFDPTVGSLWVTMMGGIAGPVGWNRVNIERRTISVPSRMALTFNGIAQGFATDQVAAVLRAHGFIDVIVDIGEIWVGGAGGKIGLPDLSKVQLRNRGLSTSVLDALTIRGQSHILHPGGGQACWNTATVEAGDATTADALSTALLLSKGTSLALKLTRSGTASRIWLHGQEGHAFLSESG